MQHIQSSFMQMQSAFDHFNEHRLKMTTGSAELDSLIDSIQEGQFYLFYGKNKAFFDGLVHGLLVNCVLPVRGHGFESMVADGSKGGVAINGGTTHAGCNVAIGIKCFNQLGR